MLACEVSVPVFEFQRIYGSIQSVEAKTSRTASHLEFLLLEYVRFSTQNEI